MYRVVLAASLVAAAVLSGSVCLAGPDTPSAAPEIARGGDAGDACFHVAMPSMDVGKLGVCITKAQSDNAAATTAGRDAFDSGLFFSGWILARAIGGSDPLGQAVAQDFWQRYVKARHAAGVSDDQVVAVLHKTAKAAADARSAAAQWGD